MRRKFPLFALIVHLSSTALLSQGLPAQGDKLETSFFFGLSGATSGIFETPAEGELPRDVGLDFDQGYVVGIRLTQNLGQHFGGELEYSVSNQPGSLTNLDPDLPVLDFSQKIHRITYGALFYASDRSAPVRPFATAAMGVSVFQVGSKDEAAVLLGANLDSQARFAGSFGGGLKFRINSSWGLRLDVRDYISTVPDYDLPSKILAGLPPIKPRSVGFNPNGIMHNWYTSIGINLYLPVN